MSVPAGAATGASALPVIELPVEGMDCAGCAAHVRTALESVEGVTRADVRLATAKAVVELDPERVRPEQLREAVAQAGYRVPEPEPVDAEAGGLAPREAEARAFLSRATRVTGLVFGAVLVFVVVGGWLGLFGRLTDLVPFPVGVGFVLLVGWPPFRNVVAAGLRGRVIAHTLMAVGVLAALAIGQWVTAAVVAFFMRVGDFVEGYTMRQGGRAIRDLQALAPRVARVVRGDVEAEVPIEQVRPGDEVWVRPGEKVPVDGTVVAGRAAVDQAAITGESMPVAAQPGTSVFAASLVSEGALRIRVDRVGEDATFGRIVRLVEEAEGHRSRVQLVADRFSARYLPVVAGVAALTFLLRRDPLATAAVLVVACSCAFALATPMAMMASIGAGARRGLLVKGGRWLELLARADVLLLDKTGTLTLGRPRVGRVVPLGGRTDDDVLRLAASVERRSEHPLAAAVVRAAREHDLVLAEPEGFEAHPGLGVSGILSEGRVRVGSRDWALPDVDLPEAAALEAEGATIVHVSVDGVPAGLIGLSDEVRADVPGAIAELRALGLSDIEILTGDHERAAASVAAPLGVSYRAGLLPEQKIEIVREHQRAGRTVVMVGDGVNDAPALAQADVGIAMGAAGTDIALEAAHIALMRDDWSLLPEAFRIARRSMSVVRLNLGFTAVYNVVGLTLAALGLLPPIFAAAAQSIPDLGILGNSARLLRAK